MSTDANQQDRLDAPAAADMTSEVDPAVSRPHWRAEDVRSALRLRFAGSGAVVMEEVGNGTGHSMNRRWADMIVMETWPSRGLTITGIEIKVSRADWLHELANPAKAEEMHQHCDEWWVAASRGVIPDIAEVPQRWGVMELAVDLAGKPKLVIVRQAAREARPPRVDRMLVAAMLRAVARNAEDRRRQDVSAEVKQLVQQQVESYRRDRASDAALSADIIAALRDQIGGDDGLHGWLNKGEVLRAIAFVYRSGLVADYGGLATLISGLLATQEKARELTDAMTAEAQRLGLSLPLLDARKRARKPRKATP